MQLPHRDTNGRVPVRRLWPGAFGEENREAGAIARLPSDIAVRMVVAGEAMPAFADDDAAPALGRWSGRSAPRCGRRRALRADGHGARRRLPCRRPGQ